MARLPATAGGELHGLGTQRNAPCSLAEDMIVSMAVIQARNIRDDKGFERPLLHTIRGAGYMIRDGIR